MNKMAIFVEGYTEIVFVDKLIREVAEKNAVLIQWRRIVGGTTCTRHNLQIQAEGPHGGQEHFVVLHDCGGTMPSRRGWPKNTHRLRGPDIER